MLIGILPLFVPSPALAHVTALRSSAATASAAPKAAASFAAVPSPEPISRAGNFAARAPRRCPAVADAGCHRALTSVAPADAGATGLTSTGRHVVAACAGEPGSATPRRPAITAAGACSTPAAQPPAK